MEVSPPRIDEAGTSDPDGLRCAAAPNQVWQQCGDTAKKCLRPLGLACFDGVGGDYTAGHTHAGDLRERAADINTDE
jgi:hypothetical protein